MSDILYDEQQMKEQYRELEKEILSQIERKYRSSMKKMLQAELDGDVDRQIQLGEELEAEGCDSPYFILCLSRGYLRQQKPARALTLLSGLEADDFNVVQQKAVCLQALGRHEQVVELLEPYFPLEEYIPLAYTTYAYSLTDRGRLAEAYEIYTFVLEKYQEGYHPGVYLLDGVFQNVIELDMVLKNTRLKEDICLYMSFLGESQMDDREQFHIQHNLILFAYYLEKKEYRELFLDLLNYIRDNRLLTNPEVLETLDSGYMSLETYAIVEDTEMSEYMLTLLQTAADLEEENPETMEETRQMLYFLQYCAGKRIPDIWQEAEQAQEKYPHCYQKIAGFMEKLKADPETACQEALQELGRSEKTTEKTDLALIRRYADSRYRDLYEGGRLVWNSEYGDTYVRDMRKIGRNDPCPCGSGKKYKQCCMNKK